MCQGFSSSTNLSLIEESILNPENLEAGTQVYEKYAAIIARVVRSQGITGPEVEDIVQETLQRMLSGFWQFNRRRRGSFRAWLRRVARSATVDWLRKNPRMDGPTARAVGHTVGMSLVQEYDTDLMEIAIRKVQLEVNPSQWAMFEKVRVQGISPKEVAAEGGHTTFAVYKANQRIWQRLRQITQELDSRGSK
jgi:RNA polymerase sigma factor (sigma-70 family)